MRSLARIKKEAKGPHKKQPSKKPKAFCLF